MIRQIELTLFKCFQLLKLPIEPLTLLSGANASGKSTVMQALVLLHQTILEHEWSTRLQLNGSEVELGTVTDVVDKVYGRREFGIGLIDSACTVRWPPPPRPGWRRRCSPAAPGRAARWSVAVMELGALVCTAARPECARCPVARQCAWRRAGSPAGPPRPGQPRYEGSDRECRGRLLGVLREATAPVPASRLATAWPDREQRARALRALVADGLAAGAGGRQVRPARQPASRRWHRRRCGSRHPKVVRSWS